MPVDNDFIEALGISITLIVSGVLLIVGLGGQSTEVIVGSIFIAMGILFIPLFYRFLSVKRYFTSSLIYSLTNEILEVIKKSGFSQVKQGTIITGFLALQRECSRFDILPPQGLEKNVKMGIFPYLPSHIRCEDLTYIRGKDLYVPLMPVNMINGHVDLVNKRKKSRIDFLESGNICMEIYEETKIKKYFDKNYTLHENNKDPMDEIDQRFKGLLKLVKYPNYHLYFIPKTMNYSGPYYMVREGDELILFLNLTSDSTEGIYTSSTDSVSEFREKFNKVIEGIKLNGGNRVTEEEINKYINNINKVR